VTDTLSAITCGAPLASFDTDDFVLTEVDYRPGDTYPRHAHDRAYLILICNGGFTEKAAHHDVEVSSGDLLVVPSEFPHRDEIGRAGARGLLVTFEPSFPRLPTRWSAILGGPLSRRMIAVHRDLQAGEELAAEEGVVATADDLANGQPEPVDTRLMRIARDLLEAHPERRLRFGDVARQAGVTPPYLARTFRRVYGRTMGAHLRSLRARRAAGMLASSTASIADIATDAGFSDQSHLCRVFRSEYGTSPLAYRRLMRRSNPFKT
jgi:AraC family transcriptional regulator